MTDVEPAQVAVVYLCGQCGNDVRLKPQDAIRCRRCGCRILYKKRTKKPMQYEAR